LTSKGDGGAAAERNIDGIGGDRLHQPRIAAEIGDLEVDAVLLEDTGGDPDIGRYEGELLRLGLADADGDLRLRRDAERHDDERGKGERACGAGLQTIRRHRHFLSAIAGPASPARHECAVLPQIGGIRCRRQGGSRLGLFSQSGRFPHAANKRKKQESTTSM
jgi:hypothetical protein